MMKKSHLLVLFFLVLFPQLSIQLHAFPIFPNITKNYPNISSNPWDTFKNFTGSQIGNRTEGLAKLKKYFQEFGYIANQTTNFTDDFDEILESALKTYQHNFNLNASGTLDESTVNQIVLPRCGNADVVNGTSTMNSGKSSSTPSSSIHSVSHYTFFTGQPRWPSTTTPLTYAFNPDDQLTDDVKAAFSRAFSKWSEVTPLTFEQISTYDSADITIAFYSGDHGDGEPFDGALGTLAHAFSPTNGRFHLDSAENWVIDGETSSSSTVDLESVAVHEIGHLLGLGHSSVEEAIMYPTISTGTKKVDLATDDIEGIQVLYGSNPNYNGTTSSSTSQERETSGAGDVHVGSASWGRGIVMVSALLLVFWL